MVYSVVTADQQFGHQGSFDHLLGEDATPEEREKLSLQKHVSKILQWHLFGQQLKIPRFQWKTA